MDLLKSFLPAAAGDGRLIRRRGLVGLEVYGQFMPLPMRGGAYGTLSVLDSLAATNQSVVEIGEQIVYRQLEVALAAVNEQVGEALRSFVETSQDRRRRYGGTDAMTMDDVDEFGRADAQKVAAAADVDFPLRKYAISVQWTRDSLEVISATQFVAQFTAYMEADMRTILREFKRALFRAANYSAVDRLVDGTTLNVKRLVNADSAPIPLGPNGESFDGATHTHYLATASFVAADLTSLITTVIEHHPTGTPRVWINRAQEATVRGFAGFTGYLDARLVAGGGTTATVARASLDNYDLNNREIGVYSAGGVSAVVTVKPWIPASYAFAWVDGAPPPLVRRIRNAARANLRLVAEDEAYPLRARSLEREHGFGVWTRTNGAVLYTGGGAYTDPTLN